MSNAIDSIAGVDDFAQMVKDTLTENERLRTFLTAEKTLLMNTRTAMVSVLCDQDENVCFSGTDADRRVIAEAITAIDVAIGGSQ